MYMGICTYTNVHICVQGHMHVYVSKRKRDKCNLLSLLDLAVAAIWMLNVLHPLS